MTGFRPGAGLAPFSWSWLFGARVSTLTTLILQINSAVDSGKFTTISVADVYAAIEKRALLKFLQISCQGNIELSVHLSGAFGDFETFYEDAIGKIFDGYAGEERRKWGVQNQGLCLAVAWTIEIIQRSLMDLELSS